MIDHEATQLKVC